MGGAWLVALAASCGALPPEAESLERHEYTGAVMGVQARLVLYAGEEPVARAAAEAAFERLRALDRALSDWNPASELSRVVARAGEGPQPVGPELYEALALSKELARASGGAFEPTVAPLVSLWRAARDMGRLPDAAALEQARRRVGWSRVLLDRGARTVALEEGTALDLGGLGKGFACDAVLTLLRARGVPRALVELGGDLALGQAPPGSEGWRVALGCGSEPSTLLLEGVGVATSGDAAQALVVDGVRYSHLVDPRTGLGTTHGRCVTVVAPSGALADGLATALSILSPAEGEALAQRYGARVFEDS